MDDSLGVIKYMKEWKCIKSNYIDFIKTLVVDILFIIITIALVYLMNKINPSKISTLQGVLIIIIYFVLLTLIYSISKFITLRIITQSKKFEKINLNLISLFFALNICLFLVLGIIFMMFRAIVMSVTSGYSSIISIVLNIIFFLLAFIYIHTNHSKFSSVSNNNIFHTLRDSLYSSLKFHKYREVYFGAILLVIYFGITYLISWSLGFMQTSPAISTIELTKSLIGWFNLGIFYILYTVTRYITLNRNA